MKLNSLLIFTCILLLITPTTASFIQHPGTLTKRSSPVNNTFSNQLNSNNISYCKTMQTTIKTINNSLPKPSIQQVPSSFSWTKNQGDWTTPAKDQGNCGSCWDFAAISIIESIINIKEQNPDLDPDLSEQYVLSCLNSAGSCRGGLPYRALQYIIETTENGNYCNGVPLEVCMPYQADDSIPCSEKSADWVEHLVPITDYGRWDSEGSNEDRQRIKTTIREKGPIVTDIYAKETFRTWGRTHHNPIDYYLYEDPIFLSNHVINIVGWHDDQTINNGGYWICKNSWGQYWGYNGFFNIEYGALGVDNGYIIWSDYNPESYNWAPVADIGGPYHGLVNETIIFTAENSFDVENQQLTYQ